MNIAQQVILNTPLLRSIGRAYPPALSKGQLSKPCATFGSNKALPWNPFSYLFGKINQAFTIFSKTRVGQWLGTWLKKINNFLQAPKKESPKATSPVPSSAAASPIAPQTATKVSPDPASPTIIEPPKALPTTSQPLGETSHQPILKQAKPKAAPKLITPHEKLMADSKSLLAAQKGIQYSTLTKGELSEKLAAFKQARHHCQSQQIRLSDELSSLQYLKINQTQILKAASSKYKKLKEGLAPTWRDVNGRALSPEAKKKIKYELKAQKGLISEFKLALGVLETKIQAYSTAFEKTKSQFDKLSLEVQKLKSWVAIQTQLDNIQPLPTRLG